MSGDALVAQAIAALEADVAVRKCLQTLFTHELENADQAMPRYAAEYEKAIRRFAVDWSGPEEGEAAK